MSRRAAPMLPLVSLHMNVLIGPRVRRPHCGELGASDIHGNRSAVA